MLIHHYLQKLLDQIVGRVQQSYAVFLRVKPVRSRQRVALPDGAVSQPHI
jgi:hypothetical protein